MLDWFDWNGTRCTTLGIHVLEQPPITLPAERTTFTNVPGRSGSLTTLEGKEVYDDMILSATCYIDSPDRINTIAAWLKGSGTVTFANRPGGFYKARIVNQIPFEKILRGNPQRSFIVNFRCFPFFYMTGITDITLTSSGSTITNPGAVASEPIITVNGTGDITLMVGTTIVELEDINSSIVLDSTLQEAYKGVTSQNSKMSGDFPMIPSGACTVSWSGNVSSIVLKPNWRTL